MKSSKKVQKMNARKPVVLVPPVGEEAYKVAASEFATYWKKITGNKPSVRKAGKKLPEGDLVLIGGDAVNPLAYELLKSGKLLRFKVRYGTDDYQILTIRDKKRKILLLAGGSGRSSIYAVYDFFHRAAGAEYFWDGDIIEENPRLKIPDLDVLESPRFEYRGLRYFAHRGLHRYQAEQWDFTDWKREIDWVMKKRMNFFMLRTGIDDLFQRTFGLEYPPEDGADPDRIDRSYHDRTSLWSLKYRGELRKKVLRYAFDRGLLHPADAGTITHWYSHTPSDFYKKNPDFPLLKQRPGYHEGLVRIWDIEDQGAWDAYWKLTQTSIEEFGQEQSRIFHTIGLAERRFGKDDAENFRIKTHTLRKIQQEISQRYPDAPIMLASWDMWMCWSREEVNELLKELDPTRVLMLDYTADDYDRKTYRDWDVYGKYPWVFGIFNAYARDSEIRNDYGMLEERVKEAAADDMCKGFIFWPELSHSDTFMLEYLAENSWSPENPSAFHAVRRYCASRYDMSIAKKMRQVWTDTLAITRALQWHRDRQKYNDAKIYTAGYCNVLASIEYPAKGRKKEHEFFKIELNRIDPDLRKGKAIVKALAALAEENFNNEMWKRDAIDIVRSILAVAIISDIRRLKIADYELKNGKKKLAKILEIGESMRLLLKVLADILETSDDFSVYRGMLRLKKSAALNPHAEQTLKSNIENGYCRTQAYELVRYVYSKEIDVFLRWFEGQATAGKPSPGARTDVFLKAHNGIKDEFYATPLMKMGPKKYNCAPAEFAEIIKLSAEALGGICF